MQGVGRGGREWDKKAQGRGKERGREGGKHTPHFDFFRNKPGDDVA